MKKSVRLMMLGIGLILNGILGAIFCVVCSIGGGYAGAIGIYMQIIPIVGSILGPILLVIGYFVSYVYDDWKK